MMDLKQIERLMAVMGRTGIKRVSLKQEGFEIELERESAYGAMAPIAQMPMMTMAPVMQDEKKVPFTSEGKEKEENGQSQRFVTSPMVGTFYAAPSPEDPPFIRLGDEIEENSVVCIIEAMKVMNEVKAGIKGKVVEILVKNGDPVEFGTKILRIL